MKISFNGLHRNIIFFCLLVLTLCTLSIAYTIAEEQNGDLQNDQLLFQNALELMSEEKYQDAEQIFQYLLAKENHMESYYIMWKYAQLLKENGDFAEAEEYYVKARNLKPVLVTNSSYLIESGEVYFQNGNYEKAKKYLENGMKRTGDKELKTVAENLLAEINNKIEDGN